MLKVTRTFLIADPMTIRSFSYENGSFVAKKKNIALCSKYISRCLITFM